MFSTKKLLTVQIYSNHHFNHQFFFHQTYTPFSIYLFPLFIIVFSCHRRIQFYLVGPVLEPTTKDHGLHTYHFIVNYWWSAWELICVTTYVYFGYQNPPWFCFALLCIHKGFLLVYRQTLFREYTNVIETDWDTFKTITITWTRVFPSLVNTLFLSLFFNPFPFTLRFLIDFQRFDDWIAGWPPSPPPWTGTSAPLIPVGTAVPASTPTTGSSVDAR
jgi:hypothetical protein